MDEEGTLLARRTHMKHALDFIGWYNHRTHQRLGISKANAEHLYLAYHEGHTGYRRGNWRNRPAVQRSATRVSRFADEYAASCPLRERSALPSVLASRAFLRRLIQASAPATKETQAKKTPGRPGARVTRQGGQTR
jgi:hypothetical protein